MFWGIKSAIDEIVNFINRIYNGIESTIEIDLIYRVDINVTIQLIFSFLFTKSIQPMTAKNFISEFGILKQLTLNND